MPTVGELMRQMGYKDKKNEEEKGGKSQFAALSQSISPDDDDDDDGDDESDDSSDSVSESDPKVKAKVDCQACKLCGPKTKKDVQGREWEDEGPAEHDPSMRKIRGNDGKSRFCPDYSLVYGKPVPDDGEEEKKEEEKGPPDTSWLVDKGYGPKCNSCGAGRGEGHCASCPHKDKCSVDEALSMINVSLGARIPRPSHR